MFSGIVVGSSGPPKMEADANKSSSFAAWSFRSLFDYKGERGKNITVQCKLCKPREKFLSTSKSSTSNLKKHLVRKHAGSEGRFVEPRRGGGVPDGAGRSEELGGESSCEAEEERPAKQAKAGGSAPKALQRRLNALVFSFMVDSLQPFSLLQTPSFLRLLDGLHSSGGALTPRAMAGKVRWAGRAMAEALASRLRGVARVCTSADLWTAGGRSYLAVTCHWLQEGSLERQSAALACAVLQAPPTCHALVGALREVHARYGLTDRLACVLTDSGSRYAPLFAELGGGCWDGERDCKGVAAGVAFEDVSQLLQSEVKELQLLVPPHQRCPAHTLGRLAQEEVRRALGGGAGGGASAGAGLYRGAMAKCAAIWSLAHSPAPAPPFLEDLGAMEGRVPRAALWGAEYRVVRQVLLLGDGQVQEACERVGAEPLSAQEVLFLQEYADVLQPLAYSLDFVQAEKKRCMLGYLLPTLLTLKAKLSEVRPVARFCGPLLAGLLAGIEARFAGLLASREARLAAATVPRLRLWWLPAAERQEARAELLEAAAAEQERSGEQRPGHGSDSDSDSDSEARFFGFAPEEPPGPARSTAELEVSNYLQDPDKSLACLNKYPTVRRLFLKYNTTLPAGGANVQRLFSYNGHVLTPQHCGIAPEHFEQVLLLRYNQELCPLSNEGWHWS